MLNRTSPVFRKVDAARQKFGGLSVFHSRKISFLQLLHIDAVVHSSGCHHDMT